MQSELRVIGNGSPGGNEYFWLGGLLLFIQQCDYDCVLVGIFSKEI